MPVLTKEHIVHFDLDTLSCVSRLTTSQLPKMQKKMATSILLIKQLQRALVKEEDGAEESEPIPQPPPSQQHQQASPPLLPPEVVDDVKNVLRKLEHLLNQALNSPATWLS